MNLFKNVMQEKDTEHAQTVIKHTQKAAKLTEKIGNLEVKYF